MIWKYLSVTIGNDFQSDCGCGVCHSLKFQQIKRMGMFDMWMYFLTMIIFISVPIWALILIGAGVLLVLGCCCYCVCKRCICRKKKKKEGKKGLKPGVDLRNVALLGNSYKEKVLTINCTEKCLVWGCIPQI